MTNALKKDDNEELAKAKAKLVAELLTSEEENLVSGGFEADCGETPGPHWREFTKFVMAQ